MFVAGFCKRLLETIFLIVFYFVMEENVCQIVKPREKRERKTIRNRKGEIDARVFSKYSTRIIRKVR